MPNLGQRPAPPRPSARPSAITLLPLVLSSILGAVIISKLSRRITASSVFTQTVKQHFVHFTPYGFANHHLNNVVTIFRSAIATTEVAPGLFRTFLFGTFLAPVMMIFLEANKRSNPLWIQYSPILVGALAQSGGLVWLPIYYILYLVLGPKRSAIAPTGKDATTDEKAGGYDRAHELRAVLPAVVVGYLIPALILENPFITLTQRQQDWVNFTWQMFPLTVGLLIPLFRAILPLDTHATAHSVEQSALLWTAALCRLVHLASIIEVFVHRAAGAPTRASVAEIVGQLASPGKVAPLSRFIYQFLLIDCSLSLLATVYFILVVPGRSKTSRAWVGLVMVVGSVVQGPGASLVWGWRTRRQEAVVVERVKRH